MYHLEVLLSTVANIISFVIKKLKGGKVKNRVSRIDREVSIQNVLMSVSDKRGLEQLVPGLLDINPDLKIYSTGGTYTRIREILGSRAERSLISVSDYTGQPEMQGGLVKTLDFKIYLGLLSETYNDDHREDLARTGAVAMDMVVVNLYPFRETVAAPGASLEDARANIDIGGPCMIRAAAKNYLRVVSVCDPDEYPELLAELSATGGKLGLETRFRLARRAFEHTAAYDRAISEYLPGIGTEQLLDTYNL